MITRPLIIPVSVLLASVDLPKDVHVASWGVGLRNDPQTEEEETLGVSPVTESIVIYLESKEFEFGDEGKPLA